MKQQIINNWLPEVQSLLNRLLEAGFVLKGGDNGEEMFKYEGDLQKFIEDLIACDESQLFVKCPSDGKVRWLQLILGNSPGELVSDYQVDPGIDSVTEAHYTEWENREQPTKLAE